MNRLISAIVAAAMTLGSAAGAPELSLAHFVEPKHPMNAAVFTPFAGKRAELPGSSLTMRQYPGGALNSVSPKPCAILLDGVAEVVFTLPGYTGDVFPMTQVVGLPGVCDSASACTEALLRARGTLEAEYDAKLLAIWANATPVLITPGKPVRTLEDLAGLKVRVTNKSDLPIVEALRASATARPVTVVNQNLANGVIDAIAIGPSGIRSFKQQEPSNHMTTSFPGSGSAFVLLMNNDVYTVLSDEERGWVDAAADELLPRLGGAFYDIAAAGGMKLTADKGVEMIEPSEDEKGRWLGAIGPALKAAKAQPAREMTIGNVMALMRGDAS